MNKKILCILLCFTLMFASLTVAVPAIKASAATKSELEDKIDEIDDKEVTADGKEKENTQEIV